MGEKNPIKRLLKIAGCVIPVSSDGKLLITQRNPRMTMFPKAWVFPGGHVEKGETLEHGAVRELIEECGIQVKQSKDKYTYNGLELGLQNYFAFESSSAMSDTDITPKNGHLIMFFMARIPEKSHEIDLSPDPNEVSATVWVDKH